MAWSKDSIDKTVAEFRIALEAMSKDGHNTHAFDVGTDRIGQGWMLLIILDKQENVNAFLRAIP